MLRGCSIAWMRLTTSAASGAGDQAVACSSSFLAVASIGVSPGRLFLRRVLKAKARTLRSLIADRAKGPCVEGKANPVRERNPLAPPARLGHAPIPRL